MTRARKRGSAVAILALAAIAIASLEPTPVAALDKRYVDQDSDLVADTPAKTVDPPTLVFAYTPGEDVALHARVWDALLQHLEKITGKKIQFFAVQSNAAELESMRAGRLHIAAFGTGSVPIAVNCAGFVPFAIMGGEHGILGYEMEIITYPGSGINGPADLKGKKLAFTSPTSNSGFKEPLVLLRSEFGLEAGRDYATVFSGRHESSILGVANKDYDAAAIANEVMRRMIARGVVKESQLKSIYKSETFPTAAFGLAHNLEPALAAKVRAAFFSFSWPGTALEREFSTLGVSKFIPITYEKAWALVRKVDAAMNVEYNCK